MASRVASVFVLLLCIGTLVSGNALLAACDEDERVKDCLGEYRYCEGREPNAATDPNSLCLLCVRALGVCLNDLKCYNATWEHYKFLCTKKAHCKNCLSSPEEAAEKPKAPPPQRESHKKHTGKGMASKRIGKFVGRLKALIKGFVRRFF